jgi:hypothetical protein
LQTTAEELTAGKATEKKQPARERQARRIRLARRQIARKPKMKKTTHQRRKTPTNAATNLRRKVESPQATRPPAIENRARRKAA